MKKIILKWFLRISAFFQISYRTMSHLFFPQWYYRLIGGIGSIHANKYALLFMNEIEVLILGIGIADWLASYNPVKNFFIVIK